MKPEVLCWQYKSKVTGTWVNGLDGELCKFVCNGYATRDIYAIPDGYVLVPVEPNDEMLRKAWDVHFCDDDGAKQIYKAMTKAAQEESE